MKNMTCSYALEMETPLGKRRGNLKLNLQGDSLNGVLTMFTITAPILDGHRNGDVITFRGEMQTLMGILSYRARGRIRENLLNMDIITKQGCYSAKGILTEKWRG